MKGEEKVRGEGRAPPTKGGGNLSHAREEWRLVDSWREAMRHSRAGTRGWWPGSDNRERTVTGARANQEGWRRPGGSQGASACDRWTRGRHIDPSPPPRFLRFRYPRPPLFSLSATRKRISRRYPPMFMRESSEKLISAEHNSVSTLCTTWKPRIPSSIALRDRDEEEEEEEEEDRSVRTGSRVKFQTWTP